MALYAVLGNPIEHSLSPQIHQNFAAQFGIDLDYRRILVEPQKFGPTLRQLHSEGLNGCNVTVPCKLDAFLTANNLTSRAHAAGAVNTIIYRSHNDIIGHNTDGDGFITDMRKRHNFDFHNKRILILGAGGATQGILQPIMELHPALVTIANRTLNKAELLEERFKDMGPMDACSLTNLPTEPYDLVINATSMGHGGTAFDIPTSILHDKTFVYDLSYGDAAEGVRAWAENAGVQSSDGLGMLVEQAALSFELWHGKKPDTTGIYQALRAA